MKIIRNKNDLQKLIDKEKNLGFVPTMGAIHSGHISLFKKSISESNKTVVSIFVNKPQFNKKSDFNSYPRNYKRDISILKRLKIDYLYLPTFKQLYPVGPNKKIKIDSFSKKLCGKNRPGHFKAVVDVVHRFIKLINPKRIYFGEKDMQQLIIIKKFFNKNNINTKIISCKTIREKNGIAYSSRNKLLKKNEKEIASKIFKLLFYTKSKIINKKISLNSIKRKIIKLGATKIDYINLLNINKLIMDTNKKNYHKVFIAYYLRDVRLIDNV